MLTPHDGIVNHLRFTPDATHLFSASADGALSATRTGSWVSDGFWKAPHGGKPITHISIHPSGKLALTLGADLTLKTWNLIKGRQVKFYKFEHITNAHSIKSTFFSFSRFLQQI